MHQIELPALEAVVQLNRCEAPPPIPLVTTVAPVSAHESLYVAAGNCLYALDASDGTARWCQQVTLIRTREVIPPPWVSYPPPPRLVFGTPRVVNGMVYVSVYGFGAYTCAFTADDGALRWWTPTDAEAAAMDQAVPLVADDIVYSGSYALNEQDGAVLWQIDIDTRTEGTLALHARADETIYATTHQGIYAINARNGQIRWRYLPDEPRHISGPPVVAGHLLYAGTSGSVWPPEKNYVFALDVETGAESWRRPIDGYIGAVVHNETIYVSSGDRYLSALDTKSALLRWRYQFAAPGHYPATSAENALYLSADGVYALSSEAGAVLWRQPLGSRPSVWFSQPVVQGGVVYLVRSDGYGHGQVMLYALDPRTGGEYWHTLYPSAIAVALA